MATGKILRPSRVFSDTNTIYTMARTRKNINGTSLAAHKGTAITVAISVPSGYALVFNVSANVTGTAGLSCACDTGETSTSCAVYLMNMLDKTVTCGANTNLCVDSFFRHT